jgi:hypothetical protein
MHPADDVKQVIDNWGAQLHKPAIPASRIKPWLCVFNTLRCSLLFLLAGATKVSIINSVPDAMEVIRRSATPSTRLGNHAWLFSMTSAAETPIPPTATTIVTIPCLVP